MIDGTPDPPNGDEGADPTDDLRKQNPGKTVAPDAGAAARSKTFPKARAAGTEQQSGTEQ